MSYIEIDQERATLSGVQRRDGFVVHQVVVADTAEAARRAIGPSARGWRTRILARGIRAGGVDVTVYVGVVLRREPAAQPERGSEESKP